MLFDNINFENVNSCEQYILFYQFATHPHVNYCRGLLLLFNELR